MTQMHTSAIPSIIDALVAAARAAIGTTVSVYDGFGVSQDPGDYLMIGVEDPNLTTAAFSASADQTTGPLATLRPRDENGLINCVAYSWNGNGDQKAARDAAFATCSAVENLLRADPTLGITSYARLVTGFGGIQGLSQNQGNPGADAMALFTVRFAARL